MGIKDNLKEQAKEEIKNKAKKYAKKIILKFVAPILLGIIVVAGGFMIIEGAIKDAADAVVKATSSLFSSDFDNTSDKPTVIVSDDMIKEIKKKMKENNIDIDETYLTDKLLKKSLEAYYATQYPYIDGIAYTDDMVKGCIYLKRNDTTDYMSYINYGDFKSKLGEGKTESNLNDAKKYFSMDDDNNIVIVTWNKSSEKVECANKEEEKDNTTSDGNYSITEYKIDQKSLTEQYAMSYKLPVLLGNMYSNEGFGIAVAELGKESKIELTILDSSTETETVNKEYFKMDYKANGTYDWNTASTAGEEAQTDTQTNTQADTQIEAVNREDFQEITWNEDYTKDPYKTTTQTVEENEISIKTTLLDTWTTKGEVTDITKKTKEDSNKDNPDKGDMDNDPKEYTIDKNKSITEEQRNEIIQKIIEAKNNTITQDNIKEIDAKVYKKMTNHNMTTQVTTKETTYTSSDMELVDNTDKFLALIKANSEGKFDKKGELVKYIKKEGKNDDEYDIESEFLSSIDMVIDILERDEEVSSYANTMKYIYYRYTNNKAYKTDLDFSSYDTSDFKDVGSDATSGSGFEQFKRWIHTYEGGKKEGKFYIVQPDGGRRK